MEQKNKQKHTEILERELTSLERNLLKTLQERLGRIRSGSAFRSAEFLDTVSASELDELEARIAESDSTKIDEIEDALTRLREGKYGICSACGTGISKKRLKARPFATMCIKCKQDAERRQMANSYRGAGISRHTDSFDLYEASAGSHNDTGETIRGNRL